MRSVADLQQYLEENPNKSEAVSELLERLFLVDKKSINRHMASVLLDMYTIDLAQPGKPVHINTELDNRAHDGSLLRYFGLILPVERPEGRTEKGSKGLSGFYVITEKGKQFVRGEITVPRSVVKRFGEPASVEGEETSFDYAYTSSLKTDKRDIVLNGEIN